MLILDESVYILDLLEAALRTVMYNPVKVF